MMMRCFRQFLALALGLVMMTSVAFAQEQKEDNKPIKDKTVQVLMRFALSLMPEVYTGPDGKKIAIDKKKPEEVLIPVDDARRIVIVAYRSAQAQRCDLKVMQTLNHNAMVKYEEVFKSWTQKQKLFINQLHIFTVLYMTGNIKIEDSDKAMAANKERPKNPDLENKYNCPDDQRKAVAASVDKYLDEVKNQIAAELKRRGKLGSNEKKNDTVKKAEK